MKLNNALAELLYHGKNHEHIWKMHFHYKMKIIHSDVEALEVL